MTKIKKKTKKSPAFIEKLSFKGTNYIIFGIGILVLILGYFIMASGDTYSFRTLTIAPIVLLIGYLVIIPIAILYKKKDNNRKTGINK